MYSTGELFFLMFEWWYFLDLTEMTSGLTFAMSSSHEAFYPLGSRLLETISMKKIASALLATLLMTTTISVNAEEGDGKGKKNKGIDRTKMSKAEIFKDADADSDGSLSLEEFTAKIITAEKQAGKSFAKFDEDQNSSLNQAEFDKGIETIYWFKVTRKPAAEWIASLDVNKDGELSFEEFKEISSGKQAEGTFQRVDKDGNGSLSEEELSKHIQSVSKPQKPGKGKAEAKDLK